MIYSLQDLIISIADTNTKGICFSYNGTRKIRAENPTSQSTLRTGPHRSIGGQDGRISSTSQWYRIYLLLLLNLTAITAKMRYLDKKWEVFLRDSLLALISLPRSAGFDEDIHDLSARAWYKSLQNSSEEIHAGSRLLPESFTFVDILHARHYCWIVYPKSSNLEKTFDALDT